VWVERIAVQNYKAIILGEKLLNISRDDSEVTSVQQLGGRTLHTPLVNLQPRDFNRRSSFDSQALQTE
jgi:hypothetical protein